MGKQFRLRRGLRVDALADVTLDVGEREVLCVMGPSGCGKTTLVHLIAGLLAPTAGSVVVDGEPVRGPGADRAVVFQDDAVFPWLTVEDNIGYGLVARKIASSEQEFVVRKFVELMGLSGFESAYPRELSAGMKKKVEMAATFANDPRVLLMDEPFGSLDFMTKEHLQGEVQKLWTARPTTTVFVTHDLEEAIFLGDRIVVLTPRPGRICATYTVPFVRPRDLRIKTSIAFQRLRKEIRDFMRWVDERGQQPISPSRVEMAHQQSDFISVVAHELRTPLSSVVALSELMLNKTYPAQTTRELVSDIHQEGRRLQRIVSDLQDVSNLDMQRLVLQPQQLIVSHVLEDLVNEAAAMCACHRVVLDCEANTTVVADAVRLEQILRNLLANAVAYSPPGSSITIRARGAGRSDAGERQPPVPDPFGDERRRGGGGRPTVAISISDEGVGVAADEVDRIFEKFYRGRDAIACRPNGSGLGLYIARQLVQLHGGTIVVESSLGRGATFTIRLPHNDNGVPGCRHEESRQGV